MLDERAHRTENGFFRKNRFLLLFLLIYIVLSLLLFDPKLFTGGDNAIYVILAESIISGKGYRDIYLPEEPPHTQYPFGFPLLLSVPLLIFGQNLLALKFFVLLTGLGSFYFMYRIGESVFREKINFIMAFYLSMPAVIEYNHRILSEMPFLCFSLGALYFFMKARELRSLFYYISFIFATYAFLIRTAGIALILGMMLFLLIIKQYKYFSIFLFIFLAVFVPWYIRNTSISHGNAYIEQLLAKDPYQIELGRVHFHELLIRIWHNFCLYSFAGLPVTLLTILKGKTGLLIMVSGYILTLFTIIGVIIRYKRVDIMEFYFLFAVFILCIWPRVWTSERLLISILPIIVIYLFLGLFWLSKEIKLNYIISVACAIFIFLNLLSLIPQVKNALANNSAYMKGDKYSGYETDWLHYFMTIEWINKNIPKDKIIMARKPEYVYLLSKHKSFLWPRTTDRHKVKEAVERSDYIIIDDFYHFGGTKRFLMPVLEKERENYSVVFETTSPEFYLLKALR